MHLELLLGLVAFGYLEKDTHSVNCNSGPAPLEYLSVLEWFHKEFLSGPGRQKKATESLRRGWVDCVGQRYDDP